MSATLPSVPFMLTQPNSVGPQDQAGHELAQHRRHPEPPADHARQARRHQDQHEGQQEIDVFHERDSLLRARSLKDAGLAGPAKVNATSLAGGGGGVSTHVGRFWGRWESFQGATEEFKVDAPAQ